MYDVLNLMGKQLCLGTGQQGGIFRGWHCKELIELRLKQLCGTKTGKFGMGSACHSFHAIPGAHTGKFREREALLSSTKCYQCTRDVEGKKLPC